MSDRILKSYSKKTNGFTLVELMIVVAIVGVLAVVALPSFKNSALEAKRSDAIAVLLQARQSMERYYSKNYTYVGATAGTTVPNKAPVDGTAENYTVSLSNLTATTFTLTATPKDSQAGDSCGVLAINQAGQKGAKGNAAGSTSSADVQSCWM